jgi:beta-mannosidase
MNKQLLNGEWQFRQCGTEEWLPATVPGGVHTDLLALGKIPDPFVSDNELKVMWVAETDWEYRRTFSSDAALFTEENVLLVCDGLDTIADVYLNGRYLGHAENMFRRWEWNVKGILHQGENELRILFSSPVRFITAKQAQLRCRAAVTSGGPHLRKGSRHWGWDWGPSCRPSASGRTSGSKASQRDWRMSICGSSTGTREMSPSRQRLRSKLDLLRR